MSDSASKWNQAKNDVLASLNLLEEFQSLGIKVHGQTPNAKGWISVHALGREQKTPSAGINVGDGEMRGRYKDFSVGKAIGFFDFVSLAKGVDYRTALSFYAKKTGVKLPESEDDSPREKFDQFKATFSVLSYYARGKQGITEEGLAKLGAFVARWPKGLSAERTNAMLGFGMYGSPALSDFDPTGYHFVPENPRGSIRKWQGKDAPEQHVKTLTLGRHGLMNEFGLANLAKAKVVVILEGISDLACAQSICPDDNGIVVLSAGGCSYHPQPEWDLKKHFTGKEVWLCFDVGDKNNAGQDGAKVWLKHLLERDIKTRNVELPSRADGSGAPVKVDFRDWVNEGHTWDEFVELANTFDLLTIDTASQLMSPHDLLLKRLGIVVIGEYEQSQRVEIFSEPCKKTVTISDVDRVSFSKLAQIIGHEKAEEHVHDGKEPQPPKVMMRDVRLAISSAAARRHFSGDLKLGAGVWKTNGDIILVQQREFSLFDGQRLTRSEVPFHHGKILDLSAATPQWFNHGEVARMVSEAVKNKDWSFDVLTEAEKLFKLWHWKHSSAPSIVSALIASTYLQTLWHWRPEVAITGASDTGKSLLAEEVIAGGLFGPLALYGAGMSEAGIRQHMRHHSKCLVLDEFEQNPHRPVILKLLRNSARGTSIYKGTSDQRGTTYFLRHIPWVAAIELGLTDQADANRFIILELEEIPRSVRGNIRLPGQQKLRELGLKLMVAGIANFHRANALADFLKGQSYEGVPGRVVESFSVPCGLLFAISGSTDREAAESMGLMLQEWDFGLQRVRDEESVLSAILTAEIWMEGGVKMSVSQMLSAMSTPEISAALHRNGLSRCMRRMKSGSLAGAGRTPVLFVYPETVKRQLLSRGPYALLQVDQYLTRIRGAERCRQRLGGAEAFQGVAIPMAEIDRIFRGEVDDADGNDGLN